MVVVQGTTVKKDFKNICDRVYGGEIYIISRPKNENIVMISEEEYSRLDRIRKKMEYIAKIEAAIAQKEAGTMQEHELIEE